MKQLFATLAVFAALAAAEMTATTTDGRHVILHDNGRWEFLRNDKVVRDIRESAIPEDMRFQVTIEYESYDKLRKDTEMYLTALEVPPEVIRDSVRAIPRGGIVHFCVPTEQIRKGMPRTFVYSVFDGKNQVFREAVPDAAARPSGKAGVSYLVSVPLFSRPKAKVLKAQVQSEDRMQTLDFDVPIPAPEPEPKPAPKGPRH